MPRTTAARPMRTRRHLARRPATSHFGLEQFEQRVLLSSVTGQFFYDINGNGVKEPEDFGSAGWTVYLDANQNGTFDGSSQNIPSGNVPLAVPPTGTTGITTSTLDVAGVGTLANLTVTIGTLTHTYDGDLLITLISPQGTRVTLSNRHGGSGDNYINTVFDDSAANAITSGSAAVHRIISSRPAALDARRAKRRRTMEAGNQRPGQR